MALAKKPLVAHPFVSGSLVDISIDSVIRKQPVKNEEKNKKGKKGDLKKPDIKEVPKSKRQLKPAAVKTKVKTPVKRVKPVIKKPVRLIRKNIGI